MMATKAKATISLAEYLAEGERRFGADKRDWKFVCPVCGNVASAREYLEAGAPEGAVGFSCIGRWKGTAIEAFGRDGQSRKGPCDYTGGGLFRLNPVRVEHDKGVTEYFEFANA